MSACAMAAGAVADLYRTRVPRPEGELEPGTLQRARLLCGLVLIPAAALALAHPNRAALDLRLRPQGTSAFPTGAYRHMEAQDVEGNLLVWFDWAQLMIWRFHPKVHVFYDGRFRTAYGPEVEDAYFGFVAREPSPTWRRPLDDWPTEWVLVPTEHPCGERMAAQADFELVYRDAQASLFRRRGADRPPAEPTLGPEVLPVIPFRPIPR
jgi:hypothetical protein